MADGEWRERFRRLLTNGDDDAAAILARFRSSADDAAFKRDANVLIARRLQEEAARFSNKQAAPLRRGRPLGPTRQWKWPIDALTGDVMAFRQMLKNGDAEAQHIHDTFGPRAIARPFWRPSTHTSTTLKRMWGAASQRQLMAWPVVSRSPVATAAACFCSYFSGPGSPPPVG